MAIFCDYKANYDRLIQRMNENPNGDFINGYGVLVSEKADLIRECTFLKTTLPPKPKEGPVWTF